MPARFLHYVGRRSVDAKKRIERVARPYRWRCGEVVAYTKGAPVSWLGILIAVAFAVALIAVSGVRPKGGRPVEGTHLMTGARVVLVFLIAVVAWVVWAR